MPHIVIIGAGFSGLGMAAQLRARGLTDFVVLEAADDIGGTWRDNRYPGCACDIPSHLYSFSFDLKPDWTHKYARQPEIWDYLQRVCDHHQLRPHIRFNQAVAEARWDEERCQWRVLTKSGHTFVANILVAGTGPLSVPAIPSVPGLDTFTGEHFHSSRWPANASLEGRRVAVVGTGASAIQFVPEIAPEVASLHLFQRTPPWIIPRPDRAFGTLEKRLLRRVPGMTRLYRYFTYVRQEMRAFGFVTEPRFLRFVQGLVTRFIEESVVDPATRAAVTPSYTLGCKRILLSNDYYPALNRDNVTLVASAVQRIEGSTIIAESGERHEVDTVIWGTGFNVRNFLSKIRVIGCDGVELHEAWQNGLEAYYGMNVAGFPNLFLLLGPNTGLGHNSVVFMAEAQIHYILACIERMQQEGWQELDVLPSAQHRFNTNLQGRMANAVWLTGCRSWYLDDHGKNDALWPGYTFSYWLQTRRPDFTAYRTGE